MTLAGVPNALAGLGCLPAIIKNCEGPEGWEDDDHAPWYDPKGNLGSEIPGAIVNGYTEKELKEYFETIEGFSSYCLTA